MMPPVSCTPVDPTASAAPRLFKSEPLQLLVVVRPATVMAPGVVGNVSMNVAPVRSVGLLLASTICNCDTPVFGRIGLVRNDLVMVGGASTVISSAAAVPLDAPAGTATVKPPIGIVLSLRPTVVPVIVAVTVQEPLAGIVPAAKETVEPLAAFVPTQLPPGVTAVRPAGNVSVNAAPVMAVPVGLLKVIVSVAVPFSGTVVALNALLMLGRATFNVSLAPAALGPILELSAPAGIVLVYVPLVADRTFTLKVQFAPAAREPPEKVSVPGLVAVALAVAVPPQPELVTVVLLLTRPAG